MCLIVSRVTAIVVVGGLGVKDQQNGPRQVPTLLHVVSFCGIGPRTFDEREQIWHFCRCPPRVLKEKYRFISDISKMCANGSKVEQEL